MAVTTLSLLFTSWLLAGGAQTSFDPLDNWHQWRGPLATGEAPHADPPLHWDAMKNIQWKAPLPGRGSATPIVWRDQVFVVTAVPTDKKAAPEDLPRINPDLPRKTTAPSNYW